MKLRLPLTAIRTKMLALFVSLVTLFVLLSGFVWYRLTTSRLEREIASRLLSVAELGRTNFSVDLVDELVRSAREISPAEYGQRYTYRSALNKIENLQASSQAKAIHIFDRHLRILASTDTTLVPGYVYPLLRSYRPELEAVFAGRGQASVRFEDEEGKVYQSAFAPLFGRDPAAADAAAPSSTGDIATEASVIAALGVDLNVAYLDILGEFKRTTVTITLLGIAVAILAGLVFARTLTRPLTDLVASAQRMERGDLGAPVEVRSGDEIGYLGAAMEDMRQGILRRDKHLRTMLAGVAHEIRNPLGGIEVFATLLRDELTEDDERRQHLKKIILEVHHLKTIVNEFLVYARPRQPVPEPFSLNAVVEDLRFLLAGELAEKELDLLMDMGGEELHVYADGDQIKRALLNLTRNAIQASRRGGTVELRARRGGERVRIVVKDHGAGIAPGDLALIFDPFFTTKGSGAGLGLSIVKSIVEENEGEIAVESAPGETTAFSIALPAARGAADRFRSAGAPPGAPLAGHSAAS
ncbi:MAG: HAMP domain-containing histidine kinase [Gemmatimonadetes bacterium]|nr:HAMP domain-containing histidine kinase [Gemmatimonadota bacterium]